MQTIFQWWTDSKVYLEMGETKKSRNDGNLKRFCAICKAYRFFIACWLQAFHLNLNHWDCIDHLTASVAIQPSIDWKLLILHMQLIINIFIILIINLIIDIIPKKIVNLGTEETRRREKSIFYVNLAFIILPFCTPKNQGNLKSWTSFTLLLQISWRHHIIHLKSQDDNDDDHLSWW